MNDMAIMLDWEKLPFDIKVNILCRLPEDMIIRLKLVSKEWYSVISSIIIPSISPPSSSSTFCGFIYGKALAVPPKRFVSFAGYGSHYSSYNISYSEKYSTHFPFKLDPDDLQDTCNGLFLVFRDSIYYVYNPTTYELIQLPHSLPKEHEPVKCFASLVFDPIKSFDYNIITTYTQTVTNPLKIHTFSSHTREWKCQDVEIDNSLNGAEWIMRSVYLNGVVYRMLNTKYLLCIDLQGKSGDLIVRTIELPKYNYIKITNGSIGESRGSLYYSNNDNLTLKIWKLKDGLHWILVYQVTMDELYSTLEPQNREHPLYGAMKRSVDKYRNTNLFNFYAFHPNSDEIFLVTPKMILNYNFKIKSLEVSNLLFEKCEILPGHNFILPYSRCSVVLNPLKF